jgi:hypothetical protein
VKTAKTLPRWPLILIALPAAVAVWSGWVGLGGMCGFGLVQPFPGIVSWHLDTAITLPVGVEAYGTYALAAWLTPGTPERARSFARRSAIGALALGMAGQVIYHLLAASHATRAPSLVVVIVSCMPVVTLGFGAALTHLLRSESAPAAPISAPELPHAVRQFETEIRSSTSDLVPSSDATVDATDPATVKAALNGHAAKAEKMFAADVTAGKVPGIRRIQTQMHVGQPKARLVQAHLRNVASTE